MRCWPPSGPPTTPPWLTAAGCDNRGGVAMARTAAVPASLELARRAVAAAGLDLVHTPAVPAGNRALYYPPGALGEAGVVMVRDGLPPSAEHDALRTCVGLHLAGSAAAASGLAG